MFEDAAIVYQKLVDYKNFEASKSLMDLGEMHENSGDISKAREAYKIALKYRKIVLGDKDTQTVQAREKLQAVVCGDVDVVCLAGTLPRARVTEWGQMTSTPDSSLVSWPSSVAFHYSEKLGKTRKNPY